MLTPPHSKFRGVETPQPPPPLFGAPDELDTIQSITYRYIDDVDLTESTSLTHLLDRHGRDSDIDETHIIRHSPYYSETQFKQLISNKAGIMYT